MARGISTGGDVVKTTVDGVSVADLFREMAEAIRLRNEARDNLAALLGFRTTAAADQIAQTSNVDDFEEASFGVVAAAWLAGKEQKGLKARTLSGYRDVLNIWLHRWDRRAVGSITHLDVQQLLTDMADRSRRRCATS